MMETATAICKRLGVPHVVLGAGSVPIFKAHDPDDYIWPSENYSSAVTVVRLGGRYRAEIQDRRRGFE